MKIDEHHATPSRREKVQENPEATAHPRPTRRRRWGFRLLALLLGVSPLLVFEGVCHVFDWGRPELSEDPFVGFREVRPLFVLNEAEGRYEIPEARQGFFRPESFSAQKPANGFRIFCLGGSTVQGRPYAVETSFTTWLELALEAAEPSRRWEVVNCGGVSYASYRLVPILEEVLDYQPDLMVLYTGHNEFLEDRSYGHLRDAPGILAAAGELGSNLRSVNLLRRAFAESPGEGSGEGSSEEKPDRPTLPAEVDALLDYRGGLEEYHRDEAWREGVIRHYAFNVRRMVALAEEAGVPIVLVNPASNLRDCPPFKSQLSDGVSAEDRRRWKRLWEQAREEYNRDIPRAIALLEQARRIDGAYAALDYQLGQLYDLADRPGEAKAAWIRAKENDVCPLRMLEPMHAALLRIAEEEDVPLVDARALFEEVSGDGIPDGQWLADHIHPTIEGHQLLADALAEALARGGFVSPKEGWPARREAAYQEHLASLPRAYFREGERRLEGLRAWAAGRATREPRSESPPGS